MVEVVDEGVSIGEVVELLNGGVVLGVSTGGVVLGVSVSVTGQMVV